MAGPVPLDFVVAANSEATREFHFPLNEWQKRRWDHFYGVSPDLCCDIWTAALS